jgi:4-hydroxybenzoate polyprenyltransferase/phosphoserine phosphatase
MLLDQTAESRPAPVPLVVDLDGTLTPTDTLAESLLRLAAAEPLTLLRTLPALAAGRAAFKRAVAQAAALEAESLVFNTQVRGLIEQARRDSRAVYLVTAADHSIAESIAEHLGVFTAVFGSDGTRNLKGEEKSRFLTDRFGAGGFDYAGDSHADLAVWRKARRAILVAPPPNLLARARADCPNVEVIGLRPAWKERLRLWLRALRVHQWAKNLLLLVPVLAAHKVGPGMLSHTLVAVLAFSLCASSVYVLNDLLDLPHDRQHARKRHRPFASGALSITGGPVLIAGLLALSAALCVFMPAQFVLILAAYYLCTLSYSLWIKRLMVADVMMLALLYTLRIFAGAAATRIPVSPWMLAFSMFLFFCLAVVKRKTELTAHVRQGKSERLSGRGYSPEDLDMLRGMAASSGYMAVLVLALYINSADVAVLYPHPWALWALCPALLYWVSRVLMLSHRGEMHDDPVVFALRDRISLGVGAGCVVAVILGAL